MSLGRVGGTVDAREAFAAEVKAIDPLFKRGDLESFWPRLRGLVASSPEREDLSRKKSHYLVSLALRSLRRNDVASARRFLEFADAHVDEGHLTPYFVREREHIWGRVRDAEREASPATGA